MKLHNSLSRYFCIVFKYHRELSPLPDDGISNPSTFEAFADDRFNPFPNNNFFYSSKLKEFTVDNFKFDENGRKFSNSVENIVGKGEIGRYEQFLPFPTVFSKALNCRHVKPGPVFTNHS